MPVCAICFSSCPNRNSIHTCAHSHIAVSCANTEQAVTTQPLPIKSPKLLPPLPNDRLTTALQHLVDAIKIFESANDTRSAERFWARFRALTAYAPDARMLEPASPSTSEDRFQAIELAEAGVKKAYELLLLDGEQAEWYREANELKTAYDVYVDEIKCARGWGWQRSFRS